MSYKLPINSAGNYGIMQAGAGLTVVNGIVSASTGLLNYGFFSDGTQTNPVANQINKVTFSNTGPANGINVVNSTELTVDNAGVYTKTFTLIVNKTSGGTSSISIWLRLNGVDIPGSRQDLELINTLAQIFTTGNYTLSIPAGGNIEMCWSSADTTVVLQALPADINPTRPSGDSVKVTLSRIS